MARRPGKKFVAPGFRTRTRWKKTHYYYDTGGVPRREIPLGTDFATALQKWAELRGEGRHKAAEAITFRYVADRYMREIAPRKAASTYVDNKREVANLYRFFDDPPVLLENVRPLHVRKYLDWRNGDSVARVRAANLVREKAGRPEIEITGEEGRVRANREKALLSAIWNQARDWGYTDRPNPCSGIKGFRESGRDVYIEDDLFALVYGAADQPLRDAMDLAYLVGQRVSDTLKLTEEHIREGAINVQQGKTKQRIRISVTGDLEALIERIRARKRNLAVVDLNALVVDERGRALTYAQLRGRFDVARDTAGIEKAGFQFRDLRAKAGSDKADSTDMRQAQRILGHKNMSMTEHYVRKRRGDKVGPTR